MRKGLAAVFVVGLLASFAALPATAARKKSMVKKSWTATAPTPNPVAGEVDSRGCAGGTGQEDVNKDTYTFKTPKHRRRGTLTVRIDFQGSWDLHILDSKNKELAKSDYDNTTYVGYEQVSGLRLRPRQTVQIVSCNWAGSPQASGKLTYAYRR
jgi:hypothetical protein